MNNLLTYEKCFSTRKDLPQTIYNEENSKYTMYIDAARDLQLGHIVQFAYCHKEGSNQIIIETMVINREDNKIVCCNDDSKDNYCLATNSETADLTLLAVKLATFLLTHNDNCWIFRLKNL